MEGTTQARKNLPQTIGGFRIYEMRKFCKFYFGNFFIDIKIKHANQPTFIFMFLKITDQDKIDNFQNNFLTINNIPHHFLLVEERPRN